MDPLGGQPYVFYLDYRMLHPRATKAIVYFEA